MTNLRIPFVRLFLLTGLLDIILTCRQRARPATRSHRRLVLLFEGLLRNFDLPETLRPTLAPAEIDKFLFESRGFRRRGSQTNRDFNHFLSTDGDISRYNVVSAIS